MGLLRWVTSTCISFQIFFIFFIYIDKLSIFYFLKKLHFANDQLNVLNSFLTLLYEPSSLIYIFKYVKYSSKAVHQGFLTRLFIFRINQMYDKGNYKVYQTKGSHHCGKMSHIGQTLHLGKSYRKIIRFCLLISALDNHAFVSKQLMVMPKRNTQQIMNIFIIVPAHLPIALYFFLNWLSKKKGNVNYTWTKYTYCTLFGISKIIIFANYIMYYKTINWLIEFRSTHWQLYNWLAFLVP